ncbi:indolepyruvate ferredoxin oxidoreductase family protein [Caballeronia sp. LZ016]|uniref:indolepyruvate ferredoxin oxidoreductase family protein n=1 Tax=Caballeronia sp. LZ016 TaxID=3038554 RepID=UPI0028578025|nr:indolepyruvate ferredoxin oxidoreductase family protein [Caballeronia sp. LZ016]MDR5741209.1 indolepyruvate ferredoxin oxidoreductase family protein [Caballeronia sp. LZ016]
MTAELSSSVSLEDKYLKPQGRVYMTGTQALVRMLLAQKARDESRGLKTGGFVSGYRGSPLGAVDQELWKARKHLEGSNIKFTPGLNEELAATAVWGTQMVNLDPNATVDGVFAMWYGKGPGVDRTGDVFKHGNIAGTSKHGGVLVVAGDDHSCKSSSLPHQSEHAFIAAMMPVMNPSGVREFVEFGLHGWAMSRYSGCWVGFKTITDTIETSSSFEVDPASVEIRIPDSYPVPPDGFSLRWPDAPLEQENRLQRERLYALLEYVRLNRLNRQVWDAPQARFGIVTTGKSYLDTREALALLGLDEEAARALGVRVLKIGVSWPLEPQGVRAFADGLSEILVVEEKRQIIEYQIKEQLYNEPVSSRPRVVGKYAEAGEWVQVPKDGILLSPNGELNASTIAATIAARLARVFGEDGLPSGVHAFLETLAGNEARPALNTKLPQRVPYFCSGCPHNTSTRVPDGSRAVAGIGCHFMSMWMDRSTETFTQMGGEGVSWIGQAPFTATRHIFANLGDGTYMHSGSLAIRAAVAAGIDITYKILYNDAVAMTGGQPVEGGPSVLQIVNQVAAEGVKQVHLVTDEPAQFDAASLPAGTRLLHRDRMEELQRELREVAGVTVIVYAQTCAAEKRRRRKQKKLADPARRVLINEEVCEGCGDCGTQSNCVSVLPLETPLGRKRTIDQSSCNKDFSCVKGFCPSFVTVEGGTLRKPRKAEVAVPSNLPAVKLPGLSEPYNVVVTGVGGTGVVTIGALMGMAAHIEGKGVLVLDMAGMAQKGGAVMSHIRIARAPEALHAARVAAGKAHLILGCDMMVAAGKDAIGLCDPARTVSVVNTDVAPTGSFARDPDWSASPQALIAQVQEHSLVTHSLEATRIATALMGDAVATNMFLLGFAWQRGFVPLEERSLMRAIELNGAAIEMNKAAFAWGRHAALDVNTVKAAAGIGEPVSVIAMPPRRQTLAQIIADRVQRLTAYQNAAYAHRYERYVREAAEKEQQRVGGEKVSREIAVSLYKLMAYKDEYEVARLHADTDFARRAATLFEGDFRLRFHLAPPLLAKKDKQGRLVKQEFGSWMLSVFRVLARAKVLRGSVFDPFGYTAERRRERKAIEEYEASMREVVGSLDAQRLDTAIELARLPQSVRGYGHVKERNAGIAEAKRAALRGQYERGHPATKAAA